jgi:hypothetical protein
MDYSVALHTGDFYFPKSREEKKNNVKTFNIQSTLFLPEIK